MSLSSLGMRLLPGVAVRTVAGGFAPKPSGIRQDAIQQSVGTGRARGTGPVGSTVSGGDDNDRQLTPEEYQRQVDYFADNEFAGVYSPDKEYPDTLAGYLQKSLDYALAPHVEFNKLTQTYRATGPGGAIESMMGPLGPLAALGQKANIANLERLQGKVDAGEKGYGVGLLDNQIVGTSPLPEFMQGTMFDPGYGTFSGMIPGTPRGISEAQHLRNLQTALTNAATPLGYDADEIFGKAIPDVTSAYNLLTYGASEGADFGNIPGGGSVVTSSVPNPLGPGYANINVPVTSGGYGGIPQGYVTTGLSGVSGTDLFNAPPAGPATIADSGAMSPEDIANTFGGDDGGGYDTSGGDDTGSSGPGSGEGSDPDDDGDSGGWGGGFGEGYSDWAKGGRVGMQNGGEASPQMGFVNKDPRTVSDSQGIADNRYTSVPQGSFVMNQPANEMHKDDLDVVLGDAEKRAGSPQNDGNMVDVALSDGERLIRPEVVDFVEKKYGGGFLDNINNTGKPEVQRRQVKYGAKIGAADGGFLADQGIEAKDVGEDVPVGDYQPISEELRTKLTKFAAKKPKRGDIRDFIKSLPPEEKLTVLFLTETQSTTDPIESMEAIGEVVNNRINSNYYDFKNIKTLDDALLKQTKRGAFQFSGLEPSTFFERAKEVKGGTASKGLAKAYAAAQNVLDPETEGANRLDPNTLFYTRKDAPSQWMRESKDLEFSTELGGHEFYRTFASPEFP